MSDSFNRLYEVIKTLIAEDGCPWDSVQTPESMKKYLVEETFEALESIAGEYGRKASKEYNRKIIKKVENITNR